MTPTYIEVDGSLGEGGGQILRAALALSMTLGRPFHMVNIRANRSKPGLKRQHLACIHAAQHICGATVTGDAINSMEVWFTPGPVQSGDYTFDIGSGGSCTLVLQAVVPALLTAGGPSRLTVTGGTHVPNAPPFEFFRDTLVPWLEKLGPRLQAKMTKPGFMQVGGGTIVVDIAPVSSLTPLSPCARGAFIGAEARIMLYNLQNSIAKRERDALLSAQWQELGLTENSIYIEEASYDAEGPGNAVLVTVRHESGATVCTCLGQRGLSSESVVSRAANRATAFVQAGVPVDLHLADQLLVPLTLAGGGSFTTEKLTRHTKTCMEVVTLFTDITVQAIQQTEKRWLITLE